MKEKRETKEKGERNGRQKESQKQADRLLSLSDRVRGKKDTDNTPRFQLHG